MQQSIVIYTALEMEARAIRQKLPNTELHVIGLRACRFPASAPAVGVCILAGLAGGLDPALKVGDVVIDSTAPLSLDHAPVPIRAGAIHTSIRAILSAEEKAQAFGATHALAVDMEQVSVRRFLEAAQIPLISIRAISDAADQTLDPAILNLVDEFGSPKPLAVVKVLSSRPALIPQLMQLRKNANLALENLGKALRWLIPILEKQP
jgi:hypothetical protein